MIVYMIQENDQFLFFFFVQNMMYFFFHLLEYIIETIIDSIDSRSDHAWSCMVHCLFHNGKGSCEIAAVD